MNRKRYDVTPDADLHPQFGTFLKMFDDGTREWTTDLGEVSEDAIVWQPYPNAHSIGTVMLHIADVEASWIQSTIAGQKRSEDELKTFLSKETDQDGEVWPTPPRKPLSWYLDHIKQVREKTNQIVRELNDPEELRSFGDKYEFTVGWILHHVITHEAYHGGQAVVLSIQHKNLTS